MTEKLVTAGVSILIAMIGVAVLATLVSKASDTPGVISAGAGGFACILKTAITGKDACGSRGLIPTVNSTIIFG